MALRPSSARWFELVVPEQDVDDAMEALAGRGQVQFEWSGERNTAQQLQSLAEPIARYRALAAAHGHYWPEPVFEKRCCTLPVDVSVQAALRQIERWLAAAEPLLARVAELRERRRTLQLWARLLPLLAEHAPDLEPLALASAGPVLAGVCVLLPKNEAKPVSDHAPDHPQTGAVPEGALTLTIDLGDLQARLGLVAAAEREQLCEQLQAQGGECLPIPDWFHGQAASCAAELSFRLSMAERELVGLEQELRRLADARGVDRAVAVLERIDWFRDTASNIQCEGNMCWITGWTSEPDAKAFDQALRGVGIDAKVSFAEPPREAERPAIVRHPRWLQPFEVFADAVGVPSVTEADPTTWVALLVPLLFGYMCGDVGHGAIIAAAGLLLRRRTRLWPLLVVCGAASMAFGFVYGDLFGYEHLLEPLWLRPLEEPLTVLLVPVLFGALVLSVGLLLHLVETCWRGQGRSEGVADAAQMLTYWGTLLAFVDPKALWLIPAGALLCAGNRLWTARDPLVLIAGLGELTEATFSLLLNTLSFIRVGAFALAHAALVSAVLSIADGVSGTAASIIILVLGNLFVIVLEGLVVSVQTSRLVLFEFFVRFFEGKGRGFEPAPLPPREPKGRA
jgi:V/A-type H+-transporting ATPase subunit I